MTACITYSNDYRMHPRIAGLKAQQRDRLQDMLLFSDAQGVVHERKSLLMTRYGMRELHWDDWIKRLEQDGIVVLDDQDLRFAEWLLALIDFTPGPLPGAHYRDDDPRPRMPSETPEAQRRRKYKSRRNAYYGQLRDEHPDFTGDQIEELVSAKFPLLPPLEAPDVTTVTAAGLIQESGSDSQTDSGIDSTPQAARGQAESPGSFAKILGEIRCGRAVSDARALHEAMARASTEDIGDAGGMGTHVRVHQHSRGIDRKRGDHIATDAVQQVVSTLIERRRRTGKRQGAAFTKLCGLVFEEMGEALFPDKPQRIEPRSLDELRDHLEVRRDVAASMGIAARALTAGEISAIERFGVPAGLLPEVLDALPARMAEQLAGVAETKARAAGVAARYGGTAAGG